MWHFRRNLNHRTHVHSLHPSTHQPHLTLTLPNLHQLSNNHHPSTLRSSYLQQRHYLYIMDQLYWKVEILHLSQLPIILSPKLPRSKGLLLMNRRNAWSSTLFKSSPNDLFSVHKGTDAWFWGKFGRIGASWLSYLFRITHYTKVAEHRLIQKSISTYLI